MFAIEAGSYVVHAKLPELGTGEILASEKGSVRIRFASGERSFSVDFASPHLSITAEAPAKPTPVKAKAKARAKSKSTKPRDRADVATLTRAVRGDVDR
jgi:hypothetical protein